ncbi:hypothetical protein A11A3_03654 [Alcanivorax hongdengensis A-11-3]|uniref:AsmA domain-containing protein n=1 Tax=Alcanivorax hongdengensis A-11-3 TaxID=1177179 RepID=L0WEJ0_9GAMM|nr:AsmA family protein [Alcanivorax hongdengensis]EKF75421.1 hypothetical protein A11A3_03654 [Alcanivorax hongdengensis A-11-3]
MGRLIKIVLITLAAIILLLIAAIFVITQVIDPNEFKPEIEKQAREQANLTLDIQGDLAWQFWPSLGVSLGKTEARIGDDKDLFAALDHASVSVAVWPLLFGQVQMDGVTLAGLQVNLEEDANGGNWENIGSQSGAESTPEESADTASSDSGSLDIPLTIPSVEVTDGKVRYRNSTDGTDIVVEHFNLGAQDVNLDKPFPLQMSLRYQDQSDMRVDLNLDTVLAADLDQNHFTLNPMTLDASIAGATTNPVDVHLEQNLDVNLDKDRVDIRDLLIKAAGTETRGKLAITGLSDQMQFAGELHTAPFDANKALKAIGEAPIETTDSAALSKVAMDATLGGPAGSLMVNPLKVTLDSSTLSGKAGLASLDSGKIVFDLNLDQITLDGYMPPDSGDKPTTAAAGGGKTGGTASLSSDPLIPVDSLRPLLLDGKLAIGKVNYDTLSASDLKFAVTAKDGVLRLTRATGNTLDGSFDATASLDVSGKTPKMQAHKSVSKIQIQPLAQWALDDDLAKGIFSLNADVSASGNSEKALVDSAKGNISLELSDGTVRGLNLYNTLVGGINDMLGKFQGLSALIPGQESGKLPNALSKDTKIVDLTSKAHLEKQVAYLDSLDAVLDKGKLSGNGWLNILNQDFDLKVGMQSPELGKSKYLQGTTWPLRCEGNLAGSPAKWCGPDKSGFEDIAKQAAAKATQDKIKDKLGIDAEGDSTEEVLKNAAQKKAKDEVNKQLQDGLKKLFN